ncbi:hypothetical protein PIB30_051611 [Stylosanthes scabra]|uniref:Uncharacterized protein n=1 Tax=Stylosanthes scabra TaxID=79078 RepID=A0ABU6RIG7_9FABA|nr:hypothetical protein [Stylosanthes scabra]
MAPRGRSRRAARAKPAPALAVEAGPATQAAKAPQDAQSLHRLNREWHIAGDLVSEQTFTPDISPPRPSARITHSEPTIRDPRLGVLPTRLGVLPTRLGAFLHDELSKQPRLGISNTRLGVPLFKASWSHHAFNAQRPALNAQRPLPSSLGSKKRLSV